MKRALPCLGVLLALSVAPAAAAPVTYYAYLSGANEAPPNASPGAGLTFVTIDDVAHTMTVDVAFSGLLAGVTASHIHVINGPGDANTADTIGPVATTTPTFTGFPSGVTSGIYARTFDMTLASSYRGAFITDAGGTTALAEAALFSGIAEGRAYLNIHTSMFPGGEIRGFLASCGPNQRVPCPTVPEPATLLLFGAAVGTLVLRRARPRAE